MIYELKNQQQLHDSLKRLILNCDLNISRDGVILHMVEKTASSLLPEDLGIATLSLLDSVKYGLCSYSN